MPVPDSSLERESEKHGGDRYGCVVQHVPRKNLGALRVGRGALHEIVE